jgi:hypothetical protein
VKDNTLTLNETEGVLSLLIASLEYTCIMGDIDIEREITSDMGMIELVDNPDTLSVAMIFGLEYVLNLLRDGCNPIYREKIDEVISKKLGIRGWEYASQILDDKRDIREIALEIKQNSSK